MSCSKTVGGRLIKCPDNYKTETGIKHDQDKLRMDLIPPEAIYAMAEVLTFGCKKYGNRNWEKGIELDRLFAATQRHLWAMWNGELLDKESGLPHSYHALTDIAMYITLGMRKNNVLRQDIFGKSITEFCEPQQLKDNEELNKKIDKRIHQILGYESGND